MNAAALRKQAELQAKIDSLATELEMWRAVSEENQLWEKHHSQIHRVARQVETASREIQKLLDRSVGDGGVLRSAREVEALSIDLHSVWEFFRSKLLLRATEPFRSYLSIADEFAWVCYEPVISRLGYPLKEPPLVFFKSVTSPYMMPRDHSYHMDIDNERMAGKDAQELLKSLPIPVIGVPWYQRTHLPDLLMVAHEVGHHVEDLGFEASVDGARVADGHAAAWESWAGEVFADVFGVLACGPAYTVALGDFLAEDPDDIAREAPSSPHWGDYPTVYLRMLFSIAVLRNTGFKDVASEIEKDWKTTYPRHAMTDYEQDCDAVAIHMLALHAEPSPMPLQELLKFKPAAHDQAEQIASAALEGRQIDSYDVRELVAGSALAFSEKSVEFHSPVGGRTPQERLFEAIAASRTSGTRSGGGAQDAGPTFVKRTAEADEASGVALFERLRTTLSKRPRGVT